ncbi:MAG TPA: hypothetical protein DCS39_02310 [Rhodobiaceae bacterium]|nr:hypothetical protein [Rhodobiaceae bacterium]|tara:strand:+ start:296 stop:1552 length:1257 start_codon:yes stop_codon:yes gene_type:complete
MSAKTKEQAEIIPPDKDENATARAGAHLRMPPLIDNEGGWRAFLARFVRVPISSFFSAAFEGGKNLVSGILYRLTLLVLIGTALTVTGYGIWQARNMSVPQFDGFWHSENDTIENSHAAGSQVGHVGADDVLIGELSETSMGQGTEFLPSGSLKTLNEQLQALDTARQNATPNSTLDIDQTSGQNIEGSAPKNNAPLSRLQAKYDDLQKKYAALLVVRDAEEQAQAAQAATNAAQNDLLARAALGDLLLRLDSGAAYDDLLEAGDLARVLRRSEWNLLALYADSGIPTRPALLTRFELWIENAGSFDELGSRILDSGSYGAILGWLRAHAAGLVTVRVAPLATAEGDIAMIANALERGRHDEAAWRMGALLRRIESDRSVNHPDVASLQLLYDDTRASAELSPMLAALRNDYIAGARP